MSQGSSRDIEQNVEMHPLREHANKEYIKSVFDTYDKNGDGKITHEELADMIREESCRFSLEESVIEQVFRMADEDANSVITFREFNNMIDNPTLGQYFKKATATYMRFIMPPGHKKGRRAKDYSLEAAVDGTGAYEELYSCSPPKLGLILISVVIVTLFMLDEIKTPNTSNFGKGYVGQYLIFNARRREEAWRYLTYMFVHIGYTHVTVNVVFQLMIGIPLEMVHGTRRVLTIYLVGVVAGSLATYITDPSVLLAGASGGVYCILTAHIAAIIMNWHEMSYAAFQLLIFLIIIGGDFGNAVYNRYWLQLDERIGYAAHLAGAVTGLLFGINMLRNIEVTKKEKIIKWCSFILFALLIITSIVFNSVGIHV